MKNKTDIFVKAVNDYPNTELSQAEQFAADTVIFPELNRQQASGKFMPFVCLVHCQPDTSSESFLLLFCVSYLPEWSTHVHYDYIRQVRMNQDEFLDWLNVTEDLLESNLKTVCYKK